MATKSESAPPVLANGKRKTLRVKFPFMRIDSWSDEDDYLGVELTVLNSKKIEEPPELPELADDTEVVPLIQRQSETILQEENALKLGDDDEYVIIGTFPETLPRNSSEEAFSAEVCSSPENCLELGMMSFVPNDLASPGIILGEDTQVTINAASLVAHLSRAGSEEQ